MYTLWAPGVRTTSAALFLCKNGPFQLRHNSNIAWPCNSWGESDRHDGWRGSNWGGNIKWIGCPLIEPRSLTELQEIVRASKKIRVVGSAHSFTPLIYRHNDSQLPTLLSLRKMPRKWEIDTATSVLTIDAGSTYSEVCCALSHTRFALSNTASLPQFSIAGAISTGTHGSSGMGKDGRLLLGGLADAVLSLEIVGPDGDLKCISKGDPNFEAYVVSLGLLGVVTQVSLALVDDFDIQQRVYGTWPPTEIEEGSLTRLLQSLPEAMSHCYSFSAFIKWNIDNPGMLILRESVPRHLNSSSFSPALSWQGTPLNTSPIKNFIEGSDFDTTGVGRWHDKLQIWMKDGKPFGPQGAPELQMEHFVPLRHATDALAATRQVVAHWGSDLLYCELRAVRADSQLLSPYTCDLDGGDTLAIANGVNGTLGETRVLQAATVLEEALAPFRAKPHWGKLSNMRPCDIRSLYGQRLDKFQRICVQVDPERKFSNSWLDNMVLDA